MSDAASGATRQDGAEAAAASDAHFGPDGHVMGEGGAGGGGADGDGGTPVACAAIAAPVLVVLLAVYTNICVYGVEWCLYAICTPS